MWLPKVVQTELVSIAADVERIRDRFTETLVAEGKLDEVVNKDSLVEIANQAISDFSTWKPLDLHIEDEANDEDIRTDLKKFLLEHSDIYDEITAMKRIHGEPLRTVIEDMDIFP